MSEYDYVPIKLTFIKILTFIKLLTIIRKEHKQILCIYLGRKGSKKGNGKTETGLRGRPISAFIPENFLK